MKKTKTSVVKKALLGVLAAGVVGAVGYFDTYPTYFAKNVQIPIEQCAKVANLVAQHAFKSQNPGVALPESILKEGAEASRLSKRIAKYIIKHNEAALLTADPLQMYVFLTEYCIASEGKAKID